MSIGFRLCFQKQQKGAEWLYSLLLNKLEHKRVGGYIQPSSKLSVTSFPVQQLSSEPCNDDAILVHEDPLRD